MFVVIWMVDSVNSLELDADGLIHSVTQSL